jgi:phosphohistidine phosphatase
MARELLIFRHGKSDWNTGAENDFERPLAKRGRKAVKRMARWMRAQALMPDHILSSTAKRARQTTSRFCRHAEIPESAVRWQEEIYLADVPTLLEVLAGCETSGRCMLVGHNPGLEDLVAYLSGSEVGDSANISPLPTAALAQLSMPDDWLHLERGCAELIGVTRPRELPA